jgi:hypothetical protein
MVWHPEEGVATFGMAFATIANSVPKLNPPIGVGLRALRGRIRGRIGTGDGGGTGEGIGGGTGEGIGGGTGEGIGGGIL